MGERRCSVGMKRLLLVALLAATTNAASLGTKVTTHFEIKLSPEQRMQQVMNRLTFGARPGEMEQVRRLGLEKWIELQLHPERIAENPVLEAKLKPLETIHMETAEVLKQYFPQFPPGIVRPVLPNEILGPEQMRKVFNGTAEERRAAIIALDPEKRLKVLALVPPNVVEGLPELKKEQEEARKKQQEEQQAEMRRLRPPLKDLLDPPQV